MKHNVCLKFITLFVIVLIISETKADIPVHCLKHQITGSWTIYTTVPETKNKNELHNHTCGHKLPSSEATALNFNMDRNLFTKKYTIELKASDEAQINNISSPDTNNNRKGLWTMVYDEGFDITFEEEQKQKLNFFAFSKYSQNSFGSQKRFPNIKSKWASHCYATLIGWYYQGNKHGCFYALKKRPRL